MPNVIKQISDVYREDPDTKEEIQVPLKKKIELEDRLDPEVDVDLQVDGFLQYTAIFEREFGFTNGGEMSIVMNLIDKLSGYDEADQKYTIFEGFNNTLYIKNIDTAEETLIKMNPNLLTYVKEIIEWMYAQEKYMTYTNV